MAENRLERIVIRDLRARCIVGIFPEERTHAQEVLITITMHARLGMACQSDRIEDTIDYKGVKLRILEMVERSQFNLIERLAEEVAAVVLETPLVQRVEVVVDKPGALRFARSVAIELVRERGPRD